MEPLSIGALFTLILTLFSSVTFLIYLYLKHVVYINVWRENGVPHEKPFILFGNVPLSYFKGEKLHGTILKETYTKFKKSRFCGLYILNEPILIINDPELIQLILVKNFNQFYNRGLFIDEHKDVLSTSISRLKDEKWKRLREKLSPVFSSGKMKLMYPLIEDIYRELVKALDKALVQSDEINVNNMMIRYTIDCISTIAYGFNANSLNNPDSTFYKYGKNSGYTGRVYLLANFFAPQFIKFMPVPKTRKTNESFFIDLFSNMIEHRRKENIVRNDFINLIMQLLDYGNGDEDRSTEKKLNNHKLTMMEAVGQSFLFFSAGYETTSTTIICCLYELALNPDIQSKLFDEICEVQSSNDGLTYEKLFEMQYLDMVFQETLRKYPVTPMLNRICSEDFKVPDSDLIIKKGRRIIIPISGLHEDPDIYPEPEKFDPTRFTPENKAKRHNFTYLPFGDGPRHCIGKRLGVLKSKLAFFHLLLNYKFSRCEQTPDSIKYKPDYFISVPCGITLKIERRNLQSVAL